MAPKSLQEQLLEAGAVTKERAQQLKKSKHKQARQQSRKHRQEDAIKQAAKKAAAEKARRDRELAQKQQAAQEKKALAAQVRQMIRENLLEDTEGDVAYRFTLEGKIRSIYVTPKAHKDLIEGRVAIVRRAGKFVLIPAEVARKIAERADYAVLFLMDKEAAKASDEDYAEHPVPDDLMW